jgi:hypothetical protein
VDDLLGPVAVEVADLAPAAGVLLLHAPARPSLLSVEAVVPAELAMARARYEIDLSSIPPFLFAISDLLFLHGSDDEVRSPEEAAKIARGSARVAPGEFMGVYWELYGLDPAVSPEVTMSLLLRRSPSGIVGGVLRWLGDAVGLLGDEAPVRVEWVEEVAAGDWMGRSLSFLVPEDAGGRYTLVLTATVPGREPVIAAREIEITDSTITPPTAGTLIRRPNLPRPTRCIPETTIETSAFLVGDAMSYFRTPRCAYLADPSWFGHYGGSDHLSEYGYDGW